MTYFDHRLQQDIFQERDDRQFASDRRAEQVARFREAAEDDVQLAAILARAEKAEGILTQLGYFSDEKNFCSLRLRKEQLDVLSRAIQNHPGMSLEQIVTASVEYWMKHETFPL